MDLDLDGVRPALRRLYTETEPTEPVDGCFYKMKLNM